MCKARKGRDKKAGFSLLETLIGVTVFVVIAVGVYQTYSAVYVLIGTTKQKIAGIALANEQLEIIRNLSFADVGIVNGVPSGKIPRVQTLTRSGVSYSVEATIRNIDDAFDGTIGGTPNDLSPADYKLVQLDISCGTCKRFESFSIASYVAPRSMELTSNNGAIFVKVFDASGLAIAGANVHIVNSLASPVIDINETTNNAGEFALIDVPPGVEAYEIAVSKEGYSSEQTYPTTLLNPHPTKTNATVISKQATQVSFSVDRVSALTIATVDESCIGLSGTDFTLTSTKLIGTEPDTPKYSEVITTGSNGEVALLEMEWGNYTLEPAVGVLGYIRYFADLPINLLPGSEQKEVVVIRPDGADPTYSILVDVKDVATGLIIPNASVVLTKDSLPIMASSNCAPTDRTLYLGLEPAIYHIVVSADGYLPFVGDVGVSNSWQGVNITLAK
ncbi:MAG: carboxypeptidase-like regulatory domain-containing protein [bacterium]|nr:carboxypeptidase-like regulatory domain-containing protein [bacterium]